MGNQKINKLSRGVKHLLDYFSVGFYLSIIVAMAFAIFIVMNPTSYRYDHFRIAKILDVKTSNTFPVTAVLFQEEGKEEPTMSILETHGNMLNLKNRIGYYVVIVDYSEVNKYGDCRKTIQDQVYEEELVMTKDKKEAEAKLKEIISKEESK